MFALGWLGMLMIVAIPSLVIYLASWGAMAIVIAVINRYSTRVSITVRLLALFKPVLLAWLVGIAIFFICGVLNLIFTQYSGNTIFRLFPFLQQISSVLIFYLFLKRRVKTKLGEMTIAAPHLWAFGVALVPMALLIVAAHIWHANSAFS
ncbi:hypothetical protein [Candidatus Accumulibacter vicinus]|nr:hypothetical protein [Candidatus Accumulibacter vicinus]